MILLDTDVISAVMQRQTDEAVVSWLVRQSMQDLRLPILVLFELCCGVASLPDSRRRRALGQGLDELLGLVIQERIAPLDGPAARKAAGPAADRRARAERWISATPSSRAWPWRGGPGWPHATPASSTTRRSG